MNGSSTHLYFTDRGCVIAELECIDIRSFGGECENRREMSEVANGDEVGDDTDNDNMFKH